MAKRWGKTSGPGGPRRSWHGADREVALFDTHRKAKRRTQLLKDVRLFTVTIAAAMLVGFSATLIDWSRPWPHSPDAPKDTPPATLSGPDKPDGQGDAPQRAVSTAQDSAGTPAATRTFGYCHQGGGTNCVVDGDTFWMDGVKIRVADIDTPETHPPRCEQEEELGNRATERFRDLLNAGPISLASIDRDEDRFGRKLRLVFRDGRSLGDTLVAEGLARPYHGGPRPGWCD